MLGSLHFGRGSGYEASELVVKALSGSDAVVFETQFGEEFLSEMNRAILDVATIENGSDVWSLLSDETSRALKGYLNKRSISLEVVSSLKPWLISIMINSQEIQRIGWDAEKGVDRKVYLMAQEQTKTLLYLEGIEDRVNMFKGLPIEEQERWLIETLNHVDEIEEDLNDTYDSWISGNLKQYEKQAFSSFLKPEFSVYLEAFVYRRNREMAERLSQFSLENKNIFAVVGAMHVLGSKSLLKELEAMGFVARRL